MSGNVLADVAAMATGKVDTTDPRLSDARTPLAHTHAQSDITGLATALAAKELTASKGAANGYAGLNASGLVPLVNLPSGLTPGTHASTHENGGLDEISVAGLSGVLADPQPPIIGATAATAVAGNDARLTDARTPTAHATSHISGADKIATGTPDGTKYLRDDFSWQAVTATTPETLQSNNAPANDVTVAAGYSVFADEEFVIADGKELVLSDGASLVIL